MCSKMVSDGPPVKLFLNLSAQFPRFRCTRSHYYCSRQFCQYLCSLPCFRMFITVIQLSAGLPRQSSGFCDDDRFTAQLCNKGPLRHQFVGLSILHQLRLLLSDVTHCQYVYCHTWATYSFAYWSQQWSTGELYCFESDDFSWVLSMFRRWFVARKRSKKQS